jgi:hypothetical protein
MLLIGLRIFFARCLKNLTTFTVHARTSSQHWQIRRNKHAFGRLTDDFSFTNCSAMSNVFDQTLRIG